MVKTPQKSGATHVALLRALNVGGNHVLGMEALAGLFTAAGCRHVRTYIQSGNVLFDADATLASRLPDLVPKAMAKAHGFQVPVLVRGALELAAVAKAHPFADKGIDPKWLHVGFLAEAPAKAKAAGLDPQRSPGDRFKVLGKEVYLHFGNGAGKTKLTAPYFDAKLGTTITLRNWNTVQKLVELMGPRTPSAP